MFDVVLASVVMVMVNGRALMLLVLMFDVDLLPRALALG